MVNNNQTSRPIEDGVCIQRPLLMLASIANTLRFEGMSAEEPANFQAGFEAGVSLCNFCTIPLEPTKSRLTHGSNSNPAEIACQKHPCEFPRVISAKKPASFQESSPNPSV
jgi:hypothetical protein